MRDKRRRFFFKAIAFLIAGWATAAQAQDEFFVFSTLDPYSGIRTLELLTNEIIYDPMRQRIYASVPSIVGPGLGNTITTINPWTGEIESAVFVGSEPSALALSDDGQYLYVGLNGAAAIRRLHLPSQTPGLQFALGFDPTFGAFLADDIEVLPGNPNAVAVTRSLRGTTSSGGLAVYDDGVMRPNTLTWAFESVDRIEFSESADLLYGYNHSSTEFGFRRIAVDANGVTVIDSTRDLIFGFYEDFDYHAGLVYATTGEVVDPDTLTQVGVFPTSGPVEADAGRGLVHYVENDFGVRTVKTFDMESFALLKTQGITSVPRHAVERNLISWGNGGLAFNTWEYTRDDRNEGFVVILPEPPFLNDVVVGFGPAIGTWKWMDNSLWERLHPRSSEAVVTGDLDGSGKSDIAVDFGSDIGLWKWMNDSKWVKLHGQSPEAIVSGDLDGRLRAQVPMPIPDIYPAEIVSTLVVGADVTLSEVKVRVVINHARVGDLTVTLQSPAGTKVVLLDRPGLPTVSSAGCLDPNMDVIFDDSAEIYLQTHCAGSDPWFTGLAAPLESLSAFNGESSLGTWRLIVSDSGYDTIGLLWDWQLLATPSVGNVIEQDDLVIGFPTLGTWKWMNDSQWVKLHSSLPELMVTGDLDGNGQDDVVIDFGPTIGLWRWMNDSQWVKLHGQSPEVMATGDLDGNGLDDVVIDFGPTIGLWRWMNNAGWIKLHNISPELVVTGDLDNNGMDEAVIDFGSTVGLWRWMNNSQWVKLHGQSPEVMATGNLDGK